MARISKEKNIFENLILIKKLNKSEKELVRKMFVSAIKNRIDLIPITRDNLEENKNILGINDKEIDRYIKELNKFLDTRNSEIINKCIDRENTLNDISYCISNNLERKYENDLSFAVNGIINMVGKAIIHETNIYENVEF